ncbi:hypothetical protein Pmani_032259 [Petrolisthes manimaculis]|uniref:Uncharacterized protein n=1 Tax=Petrolisthes manimaculis TaxID=1843537 RepID=A0AAE1NS19_9EUCA|nr:hypothetical protein Pmani_032259 [Petrolisthes manimaculis]
MATEEGRVWVGTERVYLGVRGRSGKKRNPPEGRAAGVMDGDHLLRRPGRLVSRTGSEKTVEFYKEAEREVL